MSSVKCFVAVPSVAAVSMIDSGPDFHLTHYS